MERIVSDSTGYPFLFSLKLKIDNCMRGGGIILVAINSYGGWNET